MKELAIGASLAEEGDDSGLSRAIEQVGSSKRMKSFGGGVILATEVIGMESERWSPMRQRSVRID